MAVDPARRRIAHLLRRAGFGAGPTEFDAWSRLGFDGAVDHLLDAPADEADLTGRAYAQGYDLTVMDGYRAMWLYRMLHTRQPLREKMALFWHGHFATSNTKVNRPGFMWEQYQLFRRAALGRFGDLLRAVARDPAMMLWLDINHSRAGQPNENFARELMELFTLGIGSFTERDVAEAARAFTGWVIVEGRAVFVPRRHDGGLKTVLGRTGLLTGDDVLNILLERPETARLLARKLVRFFVSDPPDEALAARLAERLRANQYDLRATLGDLFRSPEFSADAARHATIKSPAELLIGTLKSFERQRIGPEHVRLMRQLGQDLFAPPTVKGWDGGRAWLSHSTFHQRLVLANALTSLRDDRGVDLAGLRADLKARGATTPEAVVNACLDWLVEGDVTAAAQATLVQYMTAGLRAPFTLDGRSGDAKLRGLLHLILTSPAFQLN